MNVPLTPSAYVCRRLRIRYYRGANDRVCWQMSVVSVICCMSNIPESIPEDLIANRNRELDRLNVSHDNWLATRHVHVIGRLLSQRWYDFVPGAFLPPL